MAKKTFPKRRGKRPSQPTPELEFEPWSRTTQKSVIAGVGILIAIVALSIWMTTRQIDDEAQAPAAMDASNRRAALADANAPARDNAFALLSWGAPANATKFTLGSTNPVDVPVIDGRATASIDIAPQRAPKRQLLGFFVTVFAGERRLFGNTIRLQDASGPRDTMTISFNAEALRAAGIGAEPLTVRIGLSETGRRATDNVGPSNDSTLGEARLRIALP